jgi:uncharacterized membrane protein
MDTSWIEDLQRYLQTIYMGAVASLFGVVLLVVLVVMMGAALGRLNDIKAMVRASAPIGSVPFHERDAEMARRQQGGQQP